MRKDDIAREARGFAYFFTTVVLVLWGLALAAAIWGGFNSGYVRYRADRPYPMVGVFAMCCAMTVEIALLFALARPFSLAGCRQVLIALAVFIGVWVGDFIFLSGATDQPGYYYANGFFLTFVVGFLVLATVDAFFIFRRQPKPVSEGAA